MDGPPLAGILRLEDVSISTIKPLPADAPYEVPSIRPHTYEPYFMRVYCPYLYAYKTADSRKSTEFVQRMKDSLKRVLQVFYPLAGRWLTPPAGLSQEAGPHPHLQCNDAGVPFIEAYVDEDMDQYFPTGKVVSVRTLDFSRFSALYDKYLDVLGVDLPNWNGEVPEEGVPPLVVQVTRFRCGGVVLVGSYSHMLMDGSSFYHFIQAWSDIALTGETSIAPELNREVIRARIPPLDPPPNSPGNPDEDRGSRGPGHLFPKRTFEVNKAVTESIKQEALKETNKSRYVSTVDSIAAHMWQSVARLPLPIKGAETVRCFGVMEGRSTFFKPPLPKHMFANVIGLALYPEIPLSKLVDGPASSVALIMRDTRAADPAQWIQPERMGQTIGVRMNPQNGIWTNTSFTGFPVYDIDFGFGKPVFACPATAERFHTELGRAVIYPPIPGHKESSATVHMELNPRIIDELCSDERFLSVFLNE